MLCAAVMPRVFDYNIIDNNNRIMIKNEKRNYNRKVMLSLPRDVIRFTLQFMNETEISITRLSCVYLYNISCKNTTMFYNHLNTQKLISWAKMYSWNEIWTVKLSRALVNNTDLIMYIRNPIRHEIMCPIDKTVYDKAIEKGNLDTLIFLTDNFRSICYYDDIYSICKRAAKYCHLHILKYLLEFRSQTEILPLRYICKKAAYSGNSEFMKWAIQFFENITDRDIFQIHKIAIIKGHTNILEILYENDSSIFEGLELYIYAIISNQIITLKWLLNKTNNREYDYVMRLCEKLNKNDFMEKMKKLLL